MLNLVYLMRPERIIMLGYDMRHVNGRIHCHGDHGGRLQNPTAKFLAECAEGFMKIQQNLTCEIINCTSNSAVRRFPIHDLRSL